MPLFKLKDYDPNYKDTFGGEDIKGYDLYTQGNEKIGSLEDALVDDSGRFRYLVIDTGPWIFGRKVLLPIGLAHFDRNQRRVLVDGLTKEQVEHLPQYDESVTVDYDYEERVRSQYRNPALSSSAPLDASAPLEGASRTTASVNQPVSSSFNRDTYTYDQEPNLFGLSDRNHQTIKLYEERLVASKTRVKRGEVSVGKHTETETARVSVPVEKERIVIERSTPTNAEATASMGNIDFQEGEVARMEVYEETADINKQAFVREEVKVSKVVEQETVEAQEQIRREELDINTEGSRSVVDRRDI